MSARPTVPHRLRVLEDGARDHALRSLDDLAAEARALAKRIDSGEREVNVHKLAAYIAQALCAVGSLHGHREARVESESGAAEGSVAS